MPAPEQHVHELRTGHVRSGRGRRHQDRRQDQDHQGRVSARGSIALVVAFTAYWIIALPLDSVSSAEQQLLLSLSAWVFLAVALALQSREVRVQVITLLCVATVLEIIGSIVWGAYTYRLGNLPLFVPAGHGLFY